MGMGSPYQKKKIVRLDTILNNPLYVKWWQPRYDKMVNQKSKGLQYGKFAVKGECIR